MSLVLFILKVQAILVVGHLTHSKQCALAFLVYSMAKVCPITTPFFKDPPCRYRYLPPPLSLVLSQDDGKVVCRHPLVCLPNHDFRGPLLHFLIQRMDSLEVNLEYLPSIVLFRLILLISYLCLSSQYLSFIFLKHFFLEKTFNVLWMHISHKLLCRNY